MRLFLAIMGSMLLLGSCKSGTSAFSKTREKKVKQFNLRLTPLSAAKMYTAAFKDTENSAADRDKILAEYRQYSCFLLEIDIDGFNAEITGYPDKPGGASPHADLLNYYLFGMQNDLKLVGEKGVEQPCTVYFFERNFALTKTNRFIVGFKQPVTDSAFTLTYANPYLGIGKVDFTITQNDFTG